MESSVLGTDFEHAMRRLEKASQALKVGHLSEFSLRSPNAAADLRAWDGIIKLSRPLQAMSAGEAPGQ